MKLGSWLVTTCVILCAGCNPPQVIQGSTVAYDDQSKALTVRDELAPNENLVLDVGSAEIGANPAPGDIVRIAYHARGGRSVALRVMNITRQTELSSGGH